jgi:ribosome-binding protein aMBF1 (putative translation factor)
MEQDWKPVVWTKKAPTKASQLKGRQGFQVTAQPKASANGQKMAKIDRTEIGSLTRVNAQLAKAIVSGRTAKKLNQKAFATACNLPLSVISGYESKKAQPKQHEIVKMQRVIGIHLTGKNIGSPMN